MAAEVASALELLQAPILNPLKLEVAMAKADHLTKSLSLHWEAGRVVENPSGCLVVYPPTLHLRKHEEEEVIVEEVIEEQQGVMEQDQSSTLVRRTQNIDVENQNISIQNAVTEDDDADVVIEEDDADVVIEKVYEDVVIEENNNEVDLFGTADLGILNGGIAEEKYANDLEHLSSGVAAVKDLNGGEVKCLLESSGEEEPGMEENLQELSVSRSQDQNLNIEAEQKGSCLLIQVETSQQVQAGGNVQYRPALPPPQPLDLQLCELSAGGVLVQPGGSPSQFFLSMADPSYAKKLKSALSEVEHPDVLETVCQGQLVLIHDGNSWRRAFVVDVEGSSVFLEKIDTGGQLSVVKAALYQVPADIASHPALGVSCCLAGVRHDYHWGARALGDWKRMVEGRSLVLRKVVDIDEGLVELALGEDGPTITSCLQFLGHVPVVPQLPATACPLPEQVLGKVGIASSDQEEPSPDFILLTFKDNPELGKSLQKLDGLQSIATTCPSPPGWVIIGSALLAPYQVSSRSFHEDERLFIMLVFVT